MVASVIVQTLSHVQAPLQVNFSSIFACHAGANVKENFLLLDYYTEINSTCPFYVREFAQHTGKSLWYNYASSKLTLTIPFVAGIEKGENDFFEAKNTPCSVDYESDYHLLPSGEAIVYLKKHNSGKVLWSEKLLGNAGTNCKISLKALDSAIYLQPDLSETIIIPEERWHNLISVVFVAISALYLIGDVNILKSLSGQTLNDVSFMKKLFLIDGPVTSISACISLLVAETSKLTPEWLVMQQSIILFCACFYVIVCSAIIFLGSKTEPLPFGTLRLSVELPILLAIFAPIVGSRGNLIYLASFLTSLISSLLVFRDSKTIFLQKSDDYVNFSENFRVYFFDVKYFHYLIIFVSLFIQAPILMLSVITEDQIESFGLRYLCAATISFTVPILAIGVK